MHDPEDLFGWPRPPAKASPPSAGRRRGWGCLAAVLGFVAFVIVFYGVGQPHAYRYRLGAMQVFEGADGVVIFAAVDLETHRPGLVRSPGTVFEPARLYRIDVGHDGSVTKLRLNPPAGKSYFLGFEPVLKLPDGVYLLEPPHLKNPYPQLHRLRGGRFEPLTVEESGQLLRSIGYTGEEERETDPVTERNGWRLLARLRRFGLDQGRLLSPRHRMQLRIQASGPVESMTAESLMEEDRWAATLLSIDARQWRSHLGQPDFR